MIRIEAKEGKDLDMKSEGIDPLWLLVILGPIGSIAGVAALLRSQSKLDRRAFFAALLNSGLLAVVVACGLFHYYGTQVVWLVISVSILSGLGGIALLDFILALARSVLTAWAGRYKDDSQDKD
jgi:hypothetical protein